MADLLSINELSRRFGLDPAQVRHRLQWRRMEADGTVWDDDTGRWVKAWDVNRVRQELKDHFRSGRAGRGRREM